jgi:hypothetical protein
LERPTRESGEICLTCDNLEFSETLSQQQWSTQKGVMIAMHFAMRFADLFSAKEVAQGSV